MPKMGAMGKIRSIILQRLQFGKELYIWGWRWVVLVVWGLPYGAIGVYDTAVGQGFLPNSLPRLASLIPDWLTNIWFLIGLFAFVAVTFEGAYRLVRVERNKSLEQPPSLADRGLLVRLISDAKSSTLQVVDNIDVLKNRNPNTIFFDPQMGERLDAIQTRYNLVCEALEREAFVGGDNYELVIGPLIVFMRKAINLNPSDIRDYRKELEEAVKVTRNKIVKSQFTSSS